MGQNFIGVPSRRYVCVFGRPKPTYTVKIPEVEFEAKGDEEAYRYVIDEIIHKGGGSEALESLTLYHLSGDNGSSSRVPMMRWRPGPGWDFTDGRQGSLYEAPPTHTPWYGKGKS